MFMQLGMYNFDTYVRSAIDNYVCFWKTQNVMF